MDANKSKLLKALKGAETNERAKNNNPFNLIPRLDLNSPGRYYLRILPNQQGPNELPYVKRFSHSGFIDPHTQKESVFSCMGKGCPLCEAAKKQIGPDGWKYKSRFSALYYVQNQQGGLAQLVASAALHSEIERVIIGKLEREQINILDPETGFDIQVTRSQKDDKTHWSVKVATTPRIVEAGTIEAWAKAKPLNKLYHEYSGEELEKVLSGTPWKKDTPAETATETKKNLPNIEKVKTTAIDNKLSVVKSEEESAEDFNSTPESTIDQISDEELADYRKKYGIL